jgi:hypothetical protein
MWFPSLVGLANQDEIFVYGLQPNMATAAQGHVSFFKALTRKKST